MSIGQFIDSRSVHLSVNDVDFEISIYSNMIPNVSYINVNDNLYKSGDLSRLDDFKCNTYVQIKHSNSKSGTISIDVTKKASQLQGEGGTSSLVYSNDAITFDNTNGEEVILATILIDDFVTNDVQNQAFTYMVRIAMDTDLLPGVEAKTVFIYNALHSIKLFNESTIILSPATGVNIDNILLEKDLTVGKVVSSHRVAIANGSEFDTDDEFEYAYKAQKLEIRLEGGSMGTGITSLNNCRGFICAGDKSSDGTVKPQLGSIPYNSYYMTDGSNGNFTSIIFDSCEVNEFDHPYLVTAYGTILVLDCKTETQTEGLGIPDVIGWHKEDVDAWNALEDRFIKYRTYNPKIFDGFYSNRDFKTDYTSTQPIYTKYYRIYYNTPMENESGYVLDFPVVFTNAFPLVKWYYYVGNMSYNQYAGTCIKWKSVMSSSVIMTNSKTLPYSEENKDLSIYSAIPKFYFKAYDKGYIAQFITDDCVTTIDPLYRYDNEISSKKFSVSDKNPLKTNYELYRWEIIGHGILNQTSSSDNGLVYPGQNIAITSGGFLKPEFQPTNVTNCLYITGWINRDKINEGVEIGKFCKVTPWLNYALEIPSDDSLHKYSIDPTINTYAEAPYKLYKVFDISGNFVKIGFWVKAAPWIYDGYWKPAPSAIQLNENLNENNGWSKSIS